MIRRQSGKIYLWMSLVTMLLAFSVSAETFVVSPIYLDSYSVQDVINKAQDGDRIIVKSGTYLENINVTKRLVLVGVDSGNGRPLVDGGSKGSAITLIADGIRLECFDVENSGAGSDDAAIKVLSNDNLLRDNTASNSSYGIYLHCCRNNTLVNNLVRRNDVGVAIYNSENNTLRGNTARNNSFAGFVLGLSRGNVLMENEAIRNAWVGIFLSDSDGNILKDDVLQLNDNEGIWLLNSSGNLLTGNDVSDSSISGIRLVASHNNTINDTRSTDNLDGINLEASHSNIITGNNLSNNNYGIYVDASSANSVYLNDFRDNVDNIYSWKSFNSWNSTGPLTYQYEGLILYSRLGNFWSDYQGRSSLGDGVGVNHYIRGQATDFWPLLSPVGSYIVRAWLG